jgi:hypothetical protein
VKTSTITLATAWILAAPAQAQITITVNQDGVIRSGDILELEARVPSPIQPPWIWTPKDALTSDGSGRARFVAPFVLRRTPCRVRAAYQLDPTLFEEVELVVDPPEYLEDLDQVLGQKELLGKGWEGPRVEYLAGTHGAKKPQDPG